MCRGVRHWDTAVLQTHKSCKEKKRRCEKHRNIHTSGWRLQNMRQKFGSINFP